MKIRYAPCTYCDSTGESRSSCGHTCGYCRGSGLAGVRDPVSASGPILFHNVKWNPKLLIDPNVPAGTIYMVMDVDMDVDITMMVKGKDGRLKEVGS